jgi:rhamnosyltransferase
MTIPEQTKILIVLVVYGEDFSKSITYTSLKANFDKGTENFGLVVYDNSAKNSQSNIDVELAYSEYFHNQNNPGVSAAYNYGWKVAKAKGFDWLLLLDQDTNLPENGLQIYKESIKSFPDVLIHAPILKNELLIISPSAYKYRRGFALKEISPGKYSLANIRPLNSGLCLNIAVLDAVGGYNEKIRLDFSDFDFMRRAAFKFNHFVVIPLIGKHQLSSLNETFDQAVLRYMFYCNGGRNSIIIFIDYIFLGIVCFLRGLKLTLKFKSLRFLIVYWQFFICKKALS